MVMRIRQGVGLAGVVSRVMWGEWAPFGSPTFYKYDQENNNFSYSIFFVKMCAHSDHITLVTTPANPTQSLSAKRANQ